MNKRLLPVIAFALIVSGLATVVVYRMLAAKMTATAEPAVAQFVVATRDFQVGDVISGVDIKLADWSGPIPKGASSKTEDFVNRGVLTPIYEGEPLLDFRLAAKGAGGGMAATIPVGMRAVAVKVNEIVGVAGFVVPGMRVDVIISGTPPNASAASMGMLTRTVLQNIEVLSAGHKIQKTAEGTPEPTNVVNLLVTPEQAEILSLASSQTQIQLILRNPIDTKEANPPGTATANLFSGKTPRPSISGDPAKPRRPKPQPVDAVPPVAPVTAKTATPIFIEVYHGAAKARTQLQDTAEAKN